MQGLVGDLSRNTVDLEPQPGFLKGMRSKLEVPARSGGLGTGYAGPQYVAFLSSKAADAQYRADVRSQWVGSQEVIQPQPRVAATLCRQEDDRAFVRTHDHPPV